MCKSNALRLLFMVLFIFGLIAIVGCSSGSDDPASDDSTITAEADTADAGGDEDDIGDPTGDTDNVDDTIAENSGIHEEDADYIWNEADVISITLNGDTIAADAGAGATISGSTITITTAATYRITGTLNDGQIIVSTKDDDPVRLILAGVNINCSNNAPISILKAEKTIIVLEDGFVNTISDGAAYPDDEDASGAVFSDDALTICGGGVLTVNGNYNDGIACKDGLIIKSGTINVNANADDGIRGKDYLIIKDGNITVNSVGDALKSDNDEDADKGYILVENGVMDITSQKDGFQAETDVLIKGGQISVTSGGGSGVVAADSAKGVKAGVSFVIDGGDFKIDSADDAIHSNGSLIINGGTFYVATGDDGIHAENSITVNNGMINIVKCFEGIEAVIITINDGEISIVSSDDGLNVAGGLDSSGMDGAAVAEGAYYLYINGGKIAVYAAGDGIDVNGSIVMSGGEVLVHGPTAQDNSAIDYDRLFKITGGGLVAAGSSGMAQAPGNTSTQYSVKVNFSIAKAANTLFHIQTSAGAELVTFAPSKTYQSVVFSSPLLQKGSTCNVFYGGTSTGTPTNGLYEGGAYTAGTKLASFTISSVITNISK